MSVIEDLCFEWGCPFPSFLERTGTFGYMELDDSGRVAITLRGKDSYTGEWDTEYHQVGVIHDPTVLAILRYLQEKNQELESNLEALEERVHSESL